MVLNFYGEHVCLSYLACKQSSYNYGAAKTKIKPKVRKRPSITHLCMVSFFDRIFFGSCKNKNGSIMYIGLVPVTIQMFCVFVYMPNIENVCGEQEGVGVTKSRLIFSSICSSTTPTVRVLGIIMHLQWEAHLQIIYPHTQVHYPC